MPLNPNVTIDELGVNLDFAFANSLSTNKSSLSNWKRYDGEYDLYFKWRGL